MKLFDLMIRYPLRCYAAAIIISGMVVGIVEAVMAPAVVYAQTLAEEKAEQKKSE